MFALFCIVILALVTVLAFLAGQVLMGLISGALCLLIVLGQFGFLDSTLRS